MPKKNIIKPPFDFDIPDYLNDAIRELVKCYEEGKAIVDCEQDEVYGAANSAFISRQISEENARWIQKYYADGGCLKDD